MISTFRISKQFQRLPYQPKFTRDELEDLTEPQLKIICKEWKVAYHDEGDDLIDDLLKHDRNLDPLWVRFLLVKGLPLPPYAAEELNKIEAGKLGDMLILKIQYQRL